jgi:integrase
MASIRKRRWVSPEERRAAAQEGRAPVKDKEAWQIDFVDQNGVRHQPQFNRRAEADAELVRLRNQVATGTYAPDTTSVAIEEACDLWLGRTVTEGLEYGTQYQYRQHVAHILAAIDGKTKLSRLTQPQCEQIRDGLLKVHSRDMARKVLQSFRSVIKEAKRRGLIPHNVAAETTIGANGRHKRKLKAGRDFPLPTEVRALLEAADPKAHAAVCVAGLAGLRASELRALPWVNVNLGDKPSVTIEQRADKWGNIGSPKSEDGSRTVPLGETAAQALRQWKLAQPPGRTLVFSTAADRPDMLGNLQRRILTPLCASAGVRRYSWHALRHYAISQWLRSCKGDFKLVQTWAGRGTLGQTLDRYGHLIPRDDQHDVIAAAERGLFAE